MTQENVTHGAMSNEQAHSVISIMMMITDMLMVLRSKVDFDEDLTCHDMILTIENHAGKKMAVKVVFWTFLGLQWGPRRPQVYD